MEEPHKDCTFEEDESSSINVGGGSGMRNNKIKIKLKIPRQEQEQEQEEIEDGELLEEEDEDELEEGEIRDCKLVKKIKAKKKQKKVGESGKRVCAICNKVFSNGKALGGHMRIHLQSHKLVSKDSNSRTRSFGPKTKETRIENSGKCVSSKPEFNNIVQGAALLSYEEPMCPVCTKDFPSMKSLFGHMRCHPEREWRGIQPPLRISNCPNPNSNDPDLGSSSGPSPSLQTVDLLGCLKGWKSTGKRGRKATATASNSSTSSISDERVNAAHNLMFLAQGLGFRRIAKNKESFSLQGKKNIIISKFNSLSNKSKIDFPLGCYSADSTEIMGQKEKENPAGAPPPAPECCDSDERCDDQKLGLITNKKMKRNGKNVMKKIKNLDSIQNRQNKNLTVEEEFEKGSKCFKCGTCNRIFPTHQALGGHRSSHKMTGGAGGVAAEDGGGGAWQHRCRICNRVFATGQGLGGHQRSHWVGPLLADQVVATPLYGGECGGDDSQENGGRRRRRVAAVGLEIDLNLPPNMDDEDDDVESR